MALKYASSCRARFHGSILQSRYDIFSGFNIVERDEKKAMHYFELAAIGGDEQAMHVLSRDSRGKGRQS